MALVLLACALVLWAAAPGQSEATSAGLLAVPASAPAFLQQPQQPAVAAAPASQPPGAQALGVLGTSVIPPGPPTGADCSAQGSQTCSATTTGSRCSARNANQNRCSIFRFMTSDPTGGSCSVSGSNGACSILPPFGSTAPSFCSTTSLVTGTNNLVCSAIGTASRELCSAKASGGSICSVLCDTCSCSVLNNGATTNSFCSTKLGAGGGTAKDCSVFTPTNPSTPTAQCSIAQGAKGRCTTFGNAPAGSCSTFATNSHCSVFFPGAAGDPCTQP